MKAGAYNLISFVECCHFRFEKYKIFFSIAQGTNPCNRVVGFGLAYYFPFDVVADVLVLELPNVF